jgi:hypothetical protein
MSACLKSCNLQSCGLIAMGIFSGFVVRKGGRRVSAPQERKKQYILDLRILSPIPARGHSSFQRGKHCGQRTKHSLTNTCSLFAREVSSISSKGINRSIFFSRLHRISSGPLTIACTQAIIQRYTMAR